MLLTHLFPMHPFSTPGTVTFSDVFRGRESVHGKQNGLIWTQVRRSQKTIRAQISSDFQEDLVLLTLLIPIPD